MILSPHAIDSNNESLKNEGGWIARFCLNPSLIFDKRFDNSFNLDSSQIVINFAQFNFNNQKYLKFCKTIENKFVIK